MNGVREEFGIPALPPDLRAMYTEGDHVLYPDVPEFVPTYSLPENHHYVGICQWTPPAPPPDWWPRMAADSRPNALIALGSSGGLRVLPAFKGLIEAFRVRRAIFKHARKKKIVLENPTEDLRAKSKKRASERYLSVEECQRLLSALTGRDHLIVRMLVQLGLRPEELFALRRDDAQGDQLRVDEALVAGRSAAVKTEASEAYVYIPAEVNLELKTWMEAHPGEPRDWLFQTTHGRPGFLNYNNYRGRILQPSFSLRPLRLASV